MGEQYFVLETKLRREKDARAEILAMGFDCFLPIEVRRRKDRSKKARPDVEYEVAMFPRYIFPRFDVRTPCGWQRLGRLRTVKGWLKASENASPSPIRDDFIDRVKAEQIAVRAAMANDQSVTLSPIPNGTRIVITQGPFATLGGIVNMTVGDRVRILLDATGFADLQIARRSVSVA